MIYRGYFGGRVALVACAAGILMLAGCQNAPTAASGAAPASGGAAKIAVTAIQAFYPDLKADAAIWVQSHPADAQLLSKVETTLDPEIAALSSDSPPTTVQAAIADIQNQVDALPATVLSAAHKGELDVVLGLSAALATQGN